MVIDQSPRRLTRGQQEILIKIFEKDVFMTSDFSMKVYPKSIVENEARSLSLDLMYTLKHFTFDRDLLNYLLEMKAFVSNAQLQPDDDRLC